MLEVIPNRTNRTRKFQHTSRLRRSFIMGGSIFETAGTILSSILVAGDQGLSPQVFRIPILSHQALNSLNLGLETSFQKLRT